MSVVFRVPLGPDIPMLDGEPLGVVRHRLMLLFYFGLTLLVLVTSYSAQSAAPSAIMLACIATQMAAGLGAAAIAILLQCALARRAGRTAVLHIGAIIVLVVAVATAVAVPLETLILGNARPDAMYLVLRFIFYTVIGELLTSIMLQSTLPHILRDLRSDSGHEGGLTPPGAAG